MTSASCYPILVEQCQDIDPNGEISFIIENSSRGTSAALALALLYLEERGMDPLEPVLLSPSDAFIENGDAFCEAVSVSEEAVKNGFLVVFGSPPTRAETGYGYVEFEEGDEPLSSVKQFIEKPNQKLAEALFKERSALWNMGHLLTTPKTFWEEIALYTPEIALFRKGEVSFEELPDISLDYALLEKSQKVLVSKILGKWSDLGSWDNLYDIMEKDPLGNSFLGKVRAIDTKGSLLISKEREIAAIGVEDLLVIDSPNALFIGKKGASQRLKEIDFKSDLVSRPWGFYAVLETGFGYKVKKIVVEPGHRLSLQMHEHRSEHWVVVSGVAFVEKGEESFFLEEKENTFIPPLTSHRLSNRGEKVLVVIEVQAGGILEEEDIIRFQDDYARDLLPC